MAKDHYIPRFILESWRNPAKGNNICIFHKDYGKSLPKGPKGICFEEDLYGSTEGFFKELDDKAAKILEKIRSLRKDGLVEIKNFGEEKKMWAGFVLYMLLRNPSKLKILREKYLRGLPMLTAEQIKKLSQYQLKELINEKNIEDLMPFAFCFFDFRKSKHRLIIGDDPLIFKPNDLLATKCRIILPLGPKEAFIAVKTDEPIVFKNQTTIICQLNRELAKQASQRIYMFEERDVSDSFLKDYFYKKQILQNSN